MASSSIRNVEDGPSPLLFQDLDPFIAWEAPSPPPEVEVQEEDDDDDDGNDDNDSFVPSSMCEDRRTTTTGSCGGFVGWPSMNDDLRLSSVHCQTCPSIVTPLLTVDHLCDTLHFCSNGFLGASMQDFPDVEFFHHEPRFDDDDDDVSESLMEAEMLCMLSMASKREEDVFFEIECTAAIEAAAAKSSSSNPLEGGKSRGKATKKRKRSSSKNLPFDEDPLTAYDPMIHCGVFDDANGGPCLGSLSCCKKGHNLTMKKLVPRPRNLHELKRQQKARLDSSSSPCCSSDGAGAKKGKASRPSKSDCERLKSQIHQMPLELDWLEDHGCSSDNDAGF